MNADSIICIYRSLPPGTAGRPKTGQRPIGTGMFKVIITLFVELEPLMLGSLK